MRPCFNSLLFCGSCKMWNKQQCSTSFLLQIIQVLMGAVMLVVVAVHFATTRQPDLFQAAKHCTFFLFLGVEVVCRGNKRGRSREGRVLSLAFTFFHVGLYFFPWNAHRRTVTLLFSPPSSYEHTQHTLCTSTREKGAKNVFRKSRGRNGGRHNHDDKKRSEVETKYGRSLISS